MITEVKERQISEPVPGRNHDPFWAVVRDGEVTELDCLEEKVLNPEKLQAYIRFLNQVIEAIKQTT